MLKNRMQRPCSCGSGKKYKDCHGDPAVNKAVYEIKKIAEKRPCGECQVCCELIGVRKLGKPYATKCEHQCAGGCAIYSDRPQDCEDWQCNWKFLPLSDECRPDKSGIMICYDQGIGSVGLHIYEVWENAIENMPAELARYIDNYANEGGKVVIVLHGTQEGTGYHTDPKYGPDTFQKQLGLHQMKDNPNFYIVERK